MSMKMNRGKNQVMYSYLPGYTFDFDKSYVIAQVESVRGKLNTDLNLNLILEAIKSQIAGWGKLATIFANAHINQFVLLEPVKVNAILFPKVFWCQNRNCGRVYDYTRSDETPKQMTCQACKTGKLAQIRFVKIHQCGDIKPLTPPYECSTCHSKNQFALDTRQSERISQFVWICQNCKASSTLFPGLCSSCDWEVISGNSDPLKKRMSIEVHRAGKVFFPHHVVLLNQPSSEMNRFLAINKWQILASAFFMNLPGLESQTIKSISSKYQQSIANPFSLSETEIAKLKGMGKSDEEIDAFRKIQEQLSGIRKNQEENLTPDHISRDLSSKTGVPEEIWVSSGRELLEAVLPFQSSRTVDLFNLSENVITKLLASQIGLIGVSLAPDFPMTHVTFGYSRGDDKPGECRVNTFPLDKDNKGKFPLFVDTIQADAIIIKLDPIRVCDWLQDNGYHISLPENATDIEQAKKAYFVQLFNSTELATNPVILSQTITSNHPEARMVFCLLHTMSHLFLKKAALLCGLDRTSLSEYVLPKALTFAIYANHRFGATIGALSSLFEQNLEEWLGQIFHETRRCIYDPVCETSGGNCHACTHLAETSCRFYNLNLGRPFLFGGEDTELGNIASGFWQL